MPDTPPLDATLRDPWIAVERSEFLERQDRLRASVAEAGLDAAVIWSRGGGGLDMGADVLWLTNHYTPQPYSGDELGASVGAAHAAAVLAPDGRLTLVVDGPWWRRDVVVADDVVQAVNVPAAAAEVLAGCAGDGRVGLVGASHMTASVYQHFAADVRAELVRDDRLIQALRIIKSPAEQALLRAAGELGSATVDAILEGVVEGATEAEAVAAGLALLQSRGGALWEAACSSGDQAHLFTRTRLPPADHVRRLEPGDLFHLDCYGGYGGYLFDIARSRCVGDDPTDAQRALLDTPVELIHGLCSLIRPGMTAGEVNAEGARMLAGAERLKVVTDDPRTLSPVPFFGHGYGMSWEEPYLVPGAEVELRPGMFLAVEVLLGAEGFGGAMHEENGVVTDTGFEIVSPARSRWW
jgi:Xaa-Pro aminopeptidase